MAFGFKPICKIPSWWEKKSLRLSNPSEVKSKSDLGTVMGATQVEDWGL